MPYLVADGHVETVVRGLLGAIDVDGGATDEQLSVLWSVTDHLWKRPDLQNADLLPLGPDEVAKVLVERGERRRFHLIMATLETCRHPISTAQVDRAEAFAAALSVDGADLGIFRDWVSLGVNRAMDDWKRCFGHAAATIGEPSLRTGADGIGSNPWAPTKADADLLGRILEFRGLAPDSLGQAYLAFYERNGIDLPGSVDGALMPAVAVSHDMNHVIAGYEPTGQGEIALGAFQTAMNDSDDNLIQFLGNLLIHEAGVLDPGGFSPVSGSLMRPGAIALLGDAFDRGSRCHRDFTHEDHLAMAAWSLDEVREEFGVPPLGVTA